MKAFFDDIHRTSDFSAPPLSLVYCLKVNTKEDKHAVNSVSENFTVSSNICECIRSVTDTHPVRFVFYCRKWLVPKNYEQISTKRKVNITI